MKMIHAENVKWLKTLALLIVSLFVIHFLIGWQGTSIQHFSPYDEVVTLAPSPAPLPRVVNGLLRWPKQSPPEGSALQAIILRTGDFSEASIKEKYVRRWPNQPLSSSNSGPKTILYYNDFVLSTDYFFGEGTSPFVRAGCPVTNCFATSNRSLLDPKDADAIIWHQRSPNRALPTSLSKKTRLVYFMMESQNYIMRDLSPLRNTFNYTMSFTRHSDIQNPYGIFVKREKPLPELLNKNYASGKTKMAVWFASHCDSKSYRESLVARIRERIPVDIYGACGKLRCPKENNQNPDKCFRKIEKTHKFYFSFENSLCKDYVTEKFFRAAMYDIIPVVFGLAPYDEIAPPKSYINVLHYATVEDFVDYLKYLDKNDTAYNEYFRWKVEYKALSHYKAPKPKDYKWVSWCRLCELLNRDAVPQTYTRIQSFHSPAQCVGGKDRTLREFAFGKTGAFGYLAQENLLKQISRFWFGKK